MRPSKALLIRNLRILSQVIFLILFFFLILVSTSETNETPSYTKFFFYFDPLLLLAYLLSNGTIIGVLLLSLIPLFLTLFLGRFFCGWVCPFGAINQFFTNILKSKNRKQFMPAKALKVKYLILIIVLVSALMGSNLTGWVDPFSLLTRSIAAFTPSVDNAIPFSVNSKISKEGLLDQEEVTTKIQRSSTQPILIGGIFIFLLLLNYYYKRFFCNVICPLGAIYGLISRIGLFNLKTNGDCNACKLCEQNCSYNGNVNNEFIKSECTLCFNCLSECPKNAVELKMTQTKSSIQQPTDLGRRKVIGSIAAGTVLACLPASSIFSKSTIRHDFMRPPGAVKEEDFLNLCMRCGQCIQSCPTSFIQPALYEAGLLGFWTPIVNAKAGSCTYECVKCSNVCPTNAIQKLTLKQKKAFKIGTAIIDKNRCFTYADGFNCTICEEACPTAEKAIQYRKESIWNFQGRKVSVNQIYVLPDLCIGCGICEEACPRKDKPGIFISSEDEIREAVSGSI